MLQLPDIVGYMVYPELEDTSLDLGPPPDDENELRLYNAALKHGPFYISWTRKH